MDNLKSKLEAVYDLLEDALKRGDLELISRYTADEFTGRDERGNTKNKLQLFASLTELIEEAQVLSWPRRITDLRRYDDVVRATAGGTFRARRKDGTIVEREIVNDDVWVEHDGNWVMVSSTAAGVVAC